MPPERTARARRDEDDLAAAGEMLRKGSKSFALAARILPPRVRADATALYAFCRVADDLVDADPNATVATIDALRGRLVRAYAGTPDDAPVDRALSRTVLTNAIPRALPEALLEGLQWDAEGRRYETLAELHAYAARVAGTVGAMMTVVMGARSQAVLARACDLGVAMQLTNIARDVGEDARRGRVYLPLAWLREAGVDPDQWLARPTFDPRLASVVQRLLAAGDELYARSDAGVAGLPPDCRVAIRAARLIYGAIGDEVARARFDSIGRRAVVPRWRKLWLLFRALPARFARAEVSPLETVEPARFLVAACGPPS